MLIDGLPMMMPTEPAVARLVETCRGDNEPLGPVSPRQVVPTLESLAANAVMAGCRPEHVHETPRKDEGGKKSPYGRSPTVSRLPSQQQQQPQT